MSAKDDIKAIKNREDLSESERVWEAIEKLAEHVDKAPDAGAKLAAKNLNWSLRSS